MAASLAALMPGWAAAAYSAEIARGMAWLAAQVQPDGSLAGESASIATPLQCRAETAVTLARLATLPPQLASAVAADGEGVTEFVARRVVVAALAGGDVAAAGAPMGDAFNEDGGFGGAPGYRSNVLDTAFAVAAMKFHRTASPVDMVSRALGQLAQGKNADGGWGIGGQSRVAATALVLLAAQEWHTSYSVGAITLAARDWLLAARTTGSYGNALDDALALLALATQTTATDVLQPLAAALTGAQAADGSWAGDPFVTALALRALWSIDNQPPPATTGGLIGVAVDAATGAPLAGAAVQLSESPGVSAESAADGSFQLSGIAPGTYNVTVARVGYEKLTAVVQLTAGQITNLGTLRMKAATLTATVTGTVKNSGGAALSGAIVAVGTVSTFTDSKGQYVLSGIPPGSATISATLSGYTTATSAAVSFEAGKIYNFSPTLYTGTPPATVLRGKVTNAATGTAIAGATVTLGAQTVTTAADGGFSFSGVAVGPFSMTVAASGYAGVTATGALVAGVNDIGTVALSRLAATVSLSGHVTDAQTGSAIAGASVVVGGGLTATTAADGSYTLSGLASTSFDITASAAGYLALGQHVSLTQAGAAVIDIALTRIQPSGIAIDSVKPSKAQYLPSETLDVEVLVRNTTAQSADIIVDALVLDPLGGVVLELKANAHGLGENPPNLPLTVPASGTTTATLSELLLRRPAGTYTILARAYDAGGRAIAEAQANFSIAEQPVLAGGLVIDPPLVQAGTQTPVRFVGELGNLGNQPIPAGDLTLTVTLEHADTQVATQPQTAVRALASGAPLNQLRGVSVDAANNIYVVNGAYNDGRVFRIAPDGTSSLALQIPTGAPNYPQLMDVALDGAGNFWLANASGGVVWKVDAQKVVTRITVSSLDSLAGIDVDAQGNLLITGQKAGEHRLLRRAASGTEAVLWANGLSTPNSMVKDGAGDFVVTNYGDNTLVKVRPNGEIVAFVSGLNRPLGITLDAAGNFYVANNGDNTVVKITPAGVKSVYASGLSQPTDVRFDGAGNLFVSCVGDHSIRKVAADGSVTAFARGIANGPTAMKYDAAGNLYIANGGDHTLRRLDPAGQAAELTTGLSGPKGLALDAAGNVLVANYSNGTVAKVSGTTKTTLLANLSNPWGIAVDGADNVLVAESGKNQLSKFDATGGLLERIESVLNSPADMVVDNAGRLIVSNGNSLTLVDAAGPRLFFRSFGLRGLAADPAGGGVFGTNNYDVYRIGYDGSATKLKTLPFYPYGLAPDGAGNLILADYSGRKIYRLDGAGNLTVLANTASYPRFLVGDGLGSVYVLFNDSKLAAVGAGGTLVPLSAFYAPPSYDYPSGLGMAADGRPLVWTNTNKIIAVNPASGAQTVLKTGIAASGVTIDGTGRLYVSNSGDHDVASYDAAGVESSRLFGFVSPRDLVWDGSQFWFVDSGRTYSLAAAPGSYPVRRAKSRVDGLAVGSGGSLVGVQSGALYRWNGSGFAQVATVAGASALQSAAVRSDGAISVADYSSSRVVTLAGNYALLADYSGVIRPTGLAVDASGRLYVASNGAGTIARFDANAPANTVPSVFARITSPGWLASDSSGRIWATSGSTVTRFDAAGSATQISTTPTLVGIYLDGATPYALAASTHQLQRWDGSRWAAFAAGLVSPEGVRSLPDGGVAVASRQNGALLKWRDGTLDTLAVGLTNPHAVDLGTDGSTLFVSGDQGSLSQVDASGNVAALSVASLIGSSQSVYGLAVRPDGKIVVSTSYSPVGVFEVGVTQPVAPPAVGTVAYQTTVPIAALPVGEQIVSVDFGTWLPPYGGDFRAEISRAGLTGGASSLLHVGPYAQGALAALTPTVAPGSQTVPLRLTLTGADFSSVSRVETALIKPTVTGVRPNGMVADRAGNIYATDGTTLRKTTPGGVTTVIASGYSFLPGMAIDSGERLYAPVNVSGTYKLLRFDLDGQATVLVANLGAAAYGVAVNGNDEIFVGQYGRLLQVSQAGAVSTYTSAGIPAPVGIAIDGKDNIYVLNSGNLVTQIKPDRSAVVLYSKGDGVDHPTFEYEGMAMTADCGENLYLAPYVWTKVGQSGEEYTLAQVIARTGQASAVLDGRKVHYDLTDMDYIAFDRFGSRILIWTDYSGGRIWQVPVTCGAIGVEAHLVTKPGQTLTGLGRPAAATVPLANGGTEYVWSLRDVTATGTSFGFDTLLEDLALGESRTVVDSGFLLFKNSFAPGDIRLPLAIPSVQVGNLVGLGVATDRASYGANATAQVTSQLINNRSGDVAGTLAIDVFDAAGVQVGSVVNQGVVIAANATIDVTGSFAIGTIVPGNYAVRAALSDNGVVLAQAATAFQVVADTGAGTATSQLVLDKGSYNGTDRVGITSRAVSASVNVVLDNLLLTVEITDPAGAVLFSRALPIAQLPAGGTLEFLSQYALSAAAPGTYVVTQVLRDGAGATLDTQVKTFTVVSSAGTGFGLRGSVAASPKEVSLGDPVSLAYTATNSGNDGHTGLPLTLRIVDPASGTVAAEFPAAIDLAAGASYASSASWRTTGKAGDVLVAALAATVAGKDIALAQDSFTLKAPPIKLELGQALDPAARVLVLAACSGHGEGNEQERLDQGAPAPSHAVASVPGRTATQSCDRDGDGHDESAGDARPGEKCGLGRAQAIDALLNSLGIAHRVTTDPAIFRAELRSGAYTTYWVSGRVDKLKDDLAQELREAVHRGESLILDGVHDERNRTLDETAAVLVRGKLGARDQTVWLLPPVFDGLPLASIGRGLKLEPAGGLTVGRFASQSGDPAVIGNLYGQGKAVLFGLDLVASLATASPWSAETGLALANLQPALPAAYGPGAYVPLTLTVKNLGQAADVEVRTTLPADARYVAAEPAPAAVPAAGSATVVWRFPLAADAEQVLHLVLRAPLTAGSYSLVSEAGTLRDGSYAINGTPQSLPLTVVAVAAQLPAVQADIGALAVSAPDKEKRDRAGAKVAAAQAAIAAGQWQSALDALIDAIDRLREITSADTVALRLTLDQVLKESEWRWLLAQQP